MNGSNRRINTPTPLLPPVIEPLEVGRKGGIGQDDESDRCHLRERFWTELLNRAKAKTLLQPNISPSQFSWIGTSAGIRGLGLNYSIRQHEGTVELYIDRGKDADELNRSILEQLATAKETIEQEFGGPFEWQRLDGKRACRIKKSLVMGGYRDESKWASIQGAMMTP